VTHRHRRRGGRKFKGRDRRWVREVEQEYRVDAKIWSTSLVGSSHYVKDL
jgi:hypothetical protein